jgi:hypothetical protein
VRGTFGAAAVLTKVSRTTLTNFGCRDGEGDCPEEKAGQKDGYSRIKSFMIMEENTAFVACLRSAGAFFREPARRNANAAGGNERVHSITTLIQTRNEGICFCNF